MLCNKVYNKSVRKKSKATQQIENVIAQVRQQSKTYDKSTKSCRIKMLHVLLVVRLVGEQQIGAVGFGLCGYFHLYQADEDCPRGEH